jgi:hypothetical protein
VSRSSKDCAGARPPISGDDATPACQPTGIWGKRWHHIDEPRLVPAAGHPRSDGDCPAPCSGGHRIRDGHCVAAKPLLNRCWASSTTSIASRRWPHEPTWNTSVVLADHESGYYRAESTAGPAVFDFSTVWRDTSSVNNISCCCWIFIRSVHCTSRISSSLAWRPTTSISAFVLTS